MFEILQKEDLINGDKAIYRLVKSDLLDELYQAWFSTNCPAYLFICDGFLWARADEESDIKYVEGFFKGWRKALNTAAIHSKYEYGEYNLPDLVTVEWLDSSPDFTRVSDIGHWFVCKHCAPLNLVFSHNTKDGNPIMLLKFGDHVVGENPTMGIINELLSICKAKNEKTH